ncbi:MAG TPA: serine hydrolase [Brevundimonas sp.]|nr:serine hydrolase [Brevundimonas sp.]
MKSLVAAAAALLFSVTAAGGVQAKPSDDNAVTEALARTMDGYVRNRDFNGVVLVARDGQVLLRRGYGTASMEAGTPNTPDNLFRVGSLTKPLTAVLTLKLVEEGRLALDGTLARYLPDRYAGTPAANVTIEQLLAHTSGLRDVPGNYTDPWWRTTARQSFTPRDYMQAWIPGELASASGEWRYNNNAYYLLGVIIETVTGQTYAEALRDRVLAPAGMDRSGVFTATLAEPGLAAGYTRASDGRMERPMYIDPSVSYAAAGVYASADDLLRFSQALDDGRLLGPAMRAEMFRDRGNQYGLGWNTLEWPAASGTKTPIQMHTGSVPGYQTMLIRSEADGGVVIVLDNFWQGQTVVQLGRDLYDVLQGAEARTPKRMLTELITPIALTGDLQAMDAAWRAAPREGAQAYDVSEGALNALGYALMRNGRLPQAIRVFEWNVEANPGSANVHDSLGEAYLAAGRRDDARASYGRALALDPESASARAALAALAE